jgi:YD repeat-containing protein
VLFYVEVGIFSSGGFFHRSGSILRRNRDENHNQFYILMNVDDFTCVLSFFMFSNVKIRIRFTATRVEVRMKIKICRIALIAAGLVSQIASAAETITYKYDARGRLTQVVRIVNTSPPVTTQYTHDKANNRKTVVVTGSSNTPQP